MKKLFILLLICTQVLKLTAQTKEYPVIDIPYKKFMLDNGLTLIVHEDHKLPIAAFNIWYHVGSKNEKPGKTGFAHLFEHIMFTSTEHWSNFDEVMQTVGGGNNNGTTNNDRTNYFETFTSTGLDRVLWTEADRMGFLLNGLDSVKVNVQRGVVQNEKRQGENQPYAVGEELTVKATYPVGHPYSWTVIGSMDDLSAASIDDVKEWFRTYYGPNNAIVSIAGDVNADSVFEKVKKYFGDIPASPPIARFTQNIAKMRGVAFQQAQDLVPQGRLQKVWNTPGWGTPEVAQLNLLGDILTNGKSSRLYKRLVYDEELASDVSYYMDDKEIGGQFYIVADAKPGVDLIKINKAINEELQKILLQGVTVDELEKAKTNYFVQFLKGLEEIGGFGGKSDVLAMCETYGGSPDAYKRILDNIKTATITDVKSVANKWLTDGEYNLEILPYGDFTNTDSKIDRKVMPPVATPPATKFPEIKSFTLSNGLKVYLVERHELPLVNMITSFGGGFSADQFAMPGTAKLTGSMMTEGTLTKSATQISDILTALGTTLSSSASMDNSVVSMSCLKTNFTASLALYADVLLHPSFPQKDFDRVKKEQLLDIEQEKASPNSLGRRIMPSLLYPAGHAYNNPLSGSGSTESIEKIMRNDAVLFHLTWFVPNNGFAVVVGDVTQAQLKTELEKNFATWKALDVPMIKLTDAPLAASSRVYIIDKPGAGQSYLYAAEIAPSATDNDHDAFALMNNMLGGTFLSRLNMNLREDKHWSYGAGSGASMVKGPSIFSARAGVQTDKTKESMVEMLKELTQITDVKPISADEFKNEQNSTILSLPGNWQSNDGVMNFLYQSILFNRGLDYPAKYSSILQNLTLDDVQNAAKKVVKPENLTWLIVGDREKIEAGIRELNFGTVKILDGDGKEIK
ncbi:MAG: insulinase family protein [Chitinophagales bacterium]|nr:insulinase family protein [Chitinophagales bacterium]